MKAFLTGAALCVFIASSLSARNVDALFPGLDARYKTRAMQDGLYIYHTPDAGKASAIPAPAITGFPALAAPVNTLLEKKPAFLVEMLLITPVSRAVNLLDVYNALGKTGALAGRTYFSHTRGKMTALFNEVYRISNEHEKRRLEDPPRILTLPAGENIYFMVHDVNFGACYYASRVQPFSQGISYRLTNTKPVSFYFVPVIKKERLDIFFYIEPVDEGIVMYALMGISMEEYAAAHVDLPSAARKRLDVIKDWILDEITGAFETNGQGKPARVGGQ